MNVLGRVGLWTSLTVSNHTNLLLVIWISSLEPFLFHPRPGPFSATYPTSSIFYHSRFPPPLIRLIHSSLIPAFPNLPTLHLTHFTISSSHFFFPSSSSFSEALSISRSFPPIFCASTFLSHLPPSSSHLPPQIFCSSLLLNLLSHCSERTM